MLANHQITDPPLTMLGVSANGIAAYLEELASPPIGSIRGQFVMVGTAEVHRTIFQNGGMDNGVN